MITRDEIELAESIGALSFTQAAIMQAMLTENEKLRAEVIALEDVAEIMNCGHERRFSTLEIGATGNEMTCARCEVERLKAENAKLRDRISDIWHISDDKRMGKNAYGFEIDTTQAAAKKLLDGDE